MARIALLLTALIVAPATVVTAAPAYADCGDPDQPPAPDPSPPLIKCSRLWLS
jgi:hypothetical protein